MPALEAYTLLGGNLPKSCELEFVIGHLVELALHGASQELIYHISLCNYLFGMTFETNK